MTDSRPTHRSRRTDDEGTADAEPTPPVRTDGGTVPPDDETPTWEDRKARRTGLARLTYEYFERSRAEDETLRRESSYVERDVLAFPYWPHEFVRNIALASFFVGIILFISAALPPHIADPADPSSTPAIILPDWYLMWTFGMLKLGPLNPDLAILGGQKLMADRTYGVLSQAALMGFLAIVPFLNKGAARRPVEQPFWAALGVGGIVYAFTVSVLSIKNLVPMNVHLIFDLTHFLPVCAVLVSYAVLRSMREGYMYELNRRYYRLRGPR
jgi:quinol-cytochrome oxidoreductase complex cytochrome b subunit